MRSGHFGRAVRGAALIGGFLVLGTGAAASDEIADFYKGKQVQFRVGSSAGGNYAAYARQLATTMSKYLPGNPTIVTLFNAAGGGRQEAAFVSNAAPRDGGVLGMTQQNVPIFYVMDPKGMKFDVSKWQWIGNAAEVGSAMAVMRSTGVTTLEGLREKQVIIGATGKTSETFMNPTLANHFLGTKFKIVSGYRGSGPLFKAMMGGETDAVAISYISFVTRFSSLVTENRIWFPFQVGLNSNPEIKSVPVMWTLGKTPLDRAAMKFIATSDKFGRTLWFPEGVPQARLAAFRTAFDKAVKDPAYIAAIRKSKLPVNPASGDAVQAAAGELFATPKEVVAHARKALGIKVE